VPEQKSKTKKGDGKAKKVVTRRLFSPKKEGAEKGGYVVQVNIYTPETIEVHRVKASVLPIRPWDVESVRGDSKKLDKAMAEARLERQVAALAIKARNERARVIAEMREDAVVKDGFIVNTSAFAEVEAELLASS
jgi:hypothetical protein